MAETNSSSSSSGIGLLGMLAILFIGLKLGKVVAWSWMWVLAPLWAPTVLAIAIIAVGLAIYAIVALVALAWMHR